MNSIASIEAAVCRALSLTPQAIQAKTRERSISWPRALVHYLCRELTSETDVAIARHYGQTSATVGYSARRRVPDAMRYPAVRLQVERVKNEAMRELEQVDTFLNQF